MANKIDSIWLASSRQIASQPTGVSRHESRIEKDEQSASHRKRLPIAGGSACLGVHPLG